MNRWEWKGQKNPENVVDVWNIVTWKIRERKSSMKTSGNVCEVRQSFPSEASAIKNYDMEIGISG